MMDRAKSEESASSWVCSHAAGSRALAIGADHGEICLALAGAGFQTAGIGVEPFAAEFGGTFPEESAAGHVQLLNTPGFDYRFPPESFDTIALNETLERLENPERLLARLKGLLSSDGALLVVCGFGAPTDSGEIQTFYPNDLRQLMKSDFRTESLEVVGKKIRFIGRSRTENEGPAGAAADDDFARAYREADRAASRTIQEQARELKRRQALLDAQRERLSRVSLQASIAAARAQEDLMSCREELSAARNELQSAQAQLESSQKAFAQTLSDAARLDRERTRALERLGSAQCSIPYRLGEILLQGARPSFNTLKAPFRLAALFARALRKWRTGEDQEEAEALAEAQRDRWHNPQTGDSAKDGAGSRSNPS